MRVLNSCFRIGLPSQWALRDNLELVRAKNKLFECFCLKNIFRGCERQGEFKLPSLE